MFGAILAELFGTFMLVAAGITPIALGAPSWIVALGFGLGLAIPVAIFGRLSGGHFNPSVSIIMWWKGKLGTSRLIPYLLAQIAGAYGAVWMIRLATPAARGSALGVATPAPTIGWISLVLIEAFGTLLLVMTILLMTDDKASEALAPSAIGGVLGLAIFAMGSLTGGSFNPARYLGPMMVTGLWPPTWQLICYLLAPILGAAVAGAIHPLIAKATPR